MAVQVAVQRLQDGSSCVVVAVSGVVVRCSGLTGSDRQRRAARHVWDRHGKSDATRRLSSVAVQVASAAVAGWLLVRVSAGSRRGRRILRSGHSLQRLPAVLHSALEWSSVAGV